ncbi:MAG: hypothetical protein H6732_03035 [Alphaproteobacteria bacterium]|nr:hypothetical protein [Alphaproteobacteria bacterium]
MLPPLPSPVPAPDRARCVVAALGGHAAAAGVDELLAGSAIHGPGVQEALLLGGGLAGVAVAVERGGWRAVAAVVVALLWGALHGLGAWRGAGLVATWACGGLAVAGGLGLTRALARAVSALRGRWRLPVLAVAPLPRGVVVGVGVAAAGWAAAGASMHPWLPAPWPTVLGLGLLAAHAPRLARAVPPRWGLVVVRGRQAGFACLLPSGAGPVHLGAMPGLEVSLPGNDGVAPLAAVLQPGVGSVRLRALSSLRSGWGWRQRVLGPGHVVDLRHGAWIDLGGCRVRLLALERWA